ncbi:MAG: MotA/TolQ/ExbB proton channel family protein [Pseudomonadales bacterium]|nr:MotA/TolQ/ExbB proton channel family protein [Pseudomonadales bacterium]
MFEIIKSGGWLMIPIILCSVTSVAICIERALVLRKTRIAPSNLVAKVWSWIKNNEMNGQKIKELKGDSPLGEILAAGLINSKHGRDIMKESIKEVGDHVIHDLERYLSSLGTIAAITPLLGLLGTVIGMIKVFNAIVVMGTGDPTVLAGGISEALITTAAGMSVAIPSLFFHRFFLRRVEELTVSMEQEAIKLVDVLHGEREVDISGVEVK